MAASLAAPPAPSPACWRRKPLVAAQSSPSPSFSLALRGAHSSSPLTLSRAPLPCPLVCHAVEGNSTTAAEEPKPAVDDASSSSPASAASSVAEVDDEEQQQQQQQQGLLEEQESLGKALSQLRQERAAPGKDEPSEAEKFWRGVLEETRLIEWPSISKVLSTTGVVVSIILGSSLVLLTVNAVLAQLSDKIFNNAPAPPM